MPANIGYPDGKKKPNPKMLGTGAAAQAGKTILDAQRRKKNRLKSVMQGLRSGRR